MIGDFPYLVIGELIHKDQNSNYSGPDKKKIFIPFYSMIARLPAPEGGRREEPASEHDPAAAQRGTRRGGGTAGPANPGRRKGIRLPRQGCAADLEHGYRGEVRQQALCFASNIPRRRRHRDSDSGRRRSHEHHAACRSANGPTRSESARPSAPPRAGS